MTTQPERLHHLLDRLLRDVLLPEEAEQLAGLVREQEATVARVRRAVDAGPVGTCCAHLIHAALTPPAESAAAKETA